MNNIVMKRSLVIAASLVTLAGMGAGSGVVSAAAASSTHPKATDDSQRLQTVISKGDQEISRRLTSLSGLTGKINSATKLTASDKASLTSEVNNTVSGLNTLKTKLDGETTASAALTDAKQIYSDYRVYALVVPKVHLVKLADDQQVTETKLTDMATKLQTRITSAQQSGKDVTTMQSQLSDLKAKTTAAQGVSNKIEHSVIGLQPTDYNSNHQVLSGDNSQLQTARQNIQAATTDAKNIVKALKQQS